MSWISDDICWCGNSDECENTECYRHTKNRRPEDGNIYTAAYLKNTNLCPSYFSSNLNNIFFVKDVRAVKRGE